MTRGDIIIINFPFTSFKESKVRPALVISNEKFNKGKNVILFAISTQKGNDLYSLEIKQKDLSLGKLLKESYIRFNNILSIEKKLVLKKVGHLKKEKLTVVSEKFLEFIT